MGICLEWYLFQSLKFKRGAYMRKRNFIIILIMVIIVILGVFLNPSTPETEQGFTSIYDISVDKRIAYIAYEDGVPGIYMKESADVSGHSLLQLNADHMILDVHFAADGLALYYIVSNKDLDKGVGSIVYRLDLQSFEQIEVFSDELLVTEIVVDPKDENILFYLRAGVFENYSPITGARPHDFDVFSYNVKDQTHNRYTELEKYGMTSLNVSEIDELVYVQMDDDDDDEQSEGADDLFETQQRVFQIELDQPEELSIVSKKGRSVDIYDFTMIPNKNEMIFQSVSNPDNDGLFEYELYHYNMKTGMETKLTDLKKSTNRPIIAPLANKVYFVVDTNFGNSAGEYHLYEMDIDGENVKEIILEY